jgi:nucleotide-binding universal stress UspA family protein
MNNKSSVRERRRMDSRQSGERALNQHTLSIRRILAPTDLTSATSKVVDYAVALARRFGAELILLHVYEAKGNADYSLNVVDDTIVDESRERAEDALRELCGEVSEKQSREARKALEEALKIYQSLAKGDPSQFVPLAELMKTLLQRLPN